MKELFDQQPRLSFQDAQHLVLIDTCFFIHTFQHQKEHEFRELFKRCTVAMTSFNVEEFIYNEHHVDEHIRERVRKFLKRDGMQILDIAVFPGNREQERAFVASIDADLLAEVSDASDAVLIAAAIKTKSTVLTKDKHHLFTIKLENYLQKYGIAVHKEYHDVV